MNRAPLIITLAAYTLGVFVACNTGGPTSNDTGTDADADGDNDADADADTDTDSDTGTETETGTEVDTEAVEECEADIAIWYEQGCALTCDPNGVPVDCEWSTISETPLSVEQSQAFCELWASPACLGYLDAMLDCWAANFDAGALCPAPCLVDEQSVLLLLEECLDE